VSGLGHGGCRLHPSGRYRLYLLWPLIDRHKAFLVSSHTMLACKVPVAGGRSCRMHGQALPRLTSRVPHPVQRRMHRAVLVSCAASGSQWQSSIASTLQQQPAFQLAVSVVSVCQQFVAAVRQQISSAFPQLQSVNKQVRLAASITAQLRAVQVEVQPPLPCTAGAEAAAV
jgi:hypothetical protein